MKIMTRLATTPIVEDQCEDFEVQLKDLFTIEDLTDFLDDGYLTLNLLPNIPPGDGIFAINDICRYFIRCDKTQISREITQINLITISRSTMENIILSETDKLSTPYFQ